MSRYEEIEAFVRTVEAGSFTAAATQLRIAKSGISRRISDLETRLGAQLIMRSTRKLSLTDAGTGFFARAKALLEDWQDAETSVADETAALSGTVRLAVPLTFGVAHLSPALISFRAAHPGVILDVDFSDSLVHLIQEGVDVAIRIGDLPDSSLVARKLSSSRMVAGASPAYLEQVGHPETPTDLLKMKELRYANRPEKSWTFISPKGGHETVSLPAAGISTNGTYLTECAVAGQGIIIEPDFIMYDALKTGALERVLPDHTLPELGIYAVYPQTRHLSRRVRALVDYLVEHFRQNAPWHLV